MIDLTLKHVLNMFLRGGESIGRERFAHADRLRTVSAEYGGTKLGQSLASAAQEVGFQEAIAVRDLRFGGLLVEKIKIDTSSKDA
ncbi:hypothetical protein DXM29_13555 [Agrobacterium tumefaciens]|nr:hypothetical protein DXM29_13555 [Agrobacterium tumefaciens]